MAHLGSPACGGWKFPVTAQRLSEAPRVRAQLRRGVPEGTGIGQHEV